MPSRYDDELWEQVPEGGEPEAVLVEFVRSLESVERALDLGCGDGRLSAEVRARELTIADVSPAALRRAGERLPDARRIELAPDEPLPLPDAAFDLVLCAETVEHARDVQLLVSEARRVLRPRGTLALTTPAHGRLTGVRVLVRGFEQPFDPRSPHVRFFTARSLRALLADVGFDAIRIESSHRTLLATASA